jgi:hypothetical protein
MSAPLPDFIVWEKRDKREEREMGGIKFEIQ